MTSLEGSCSTLPPQRHRPSFIRGECEPGEPSCERECPTCLIPQTGETQMDNRQLVRISKYLSRHLRHQPERLGLALEEGGWVDVDTLLAACERNGFRLTRAELEEVVARSDKQRFAFNETGERIRAN